MRYAAHFVLSVALAGLIGSGQSFAQAQKSVPAPRPARVAFDASGSGAAAQSPESKRRLETFQKVWTTLNDFYFDRTFNNLDWLKVRAEYEPKARAAKTDRELHSLLNEMIGRLKRSHLAIIAPEIYQAIEKAKVEAKYRELARSEKLPDSSGGAAQGSDEGPNFDDPLAQYGIGVDLRLLNDRFVITRIDRDSAAEHAGLKIGYIIEKVNGVSLSDLLRRIDLLSDNADKVKKRLPLEIESSFLNGEKDSYVSITYLDEGETSKEIRIRRDRLKAETIVIGPNIPERQLEFETASLDENVGYIRFNFFAVPVIGKFCDAVSEFRDKKALIIDLRGNMGGVLASLVGLGGMLTDSSIDLGTSIYKSGGEKLSARTKAKNFKGKVIVLVDSQTVSAAEVFAAALQDAGRAIVVGEQTAGEALPSRAVNLPTGAVLQYPIANYRSPSGKFLEGNGVKPDISVALDRRTLLSGRDPQIAAALQAIKDEKKFVVRAAVEPNETSVPAIAAAAPPPPRRVPRAAGASADTNESALQETAVPPSPSAKPDSNVKDPEALKIIGEFMSSIGGDDAVRQITSYRGSGKADLLVKGATNQFDIGIYYQNPGKYTEILRSDASGEIREVHNGKINFVQSDYGLSQELPFFADTGDLDILAPIRTLTDPTFYRSLSFVGTYDRQGRKVKVVDARTKDGYYLALAFDVDDKSLVSFTGSYYTLIFSDYRRVGNISLPFRVERERVMNISFDEIKVNEKIDESFFSKKENCFDREN